MPRSGLVDHHRLTGLQSPIRMGVPKTRPGDGRPIAQNQGVQFQIAETYIEVEAADLMRWKACAPNDAHQPCRAEATMAKNLAAKASWEAANACLQYHGGFGFACEYDVEHDVLSFDVDGRERFIEVKTASFGKQTPLC